MKLQIQFGGETKQMGDFEDEVLKADKNYIEDVKQFLTKQGK